MKVIQIVPRLPPAVDGVGDYALSLARDLRAHHNIQTEFLVCDPHWSGPERVSDFCIYKLQRQDAKSFKDCFEYILDLKKPQVLILQYVSYGYDKHGGPVWLVDALTAAKETNPRLALITMFHEVAASSWKPWTRTFWNQLRQLKIAREIFKLSQMTLTSSDFQKRKIERMSPVQKNIICLPVPSNVGEADCPPSWGGRENAAVIFGNNKLQIKKNFSNIIKMARKLKIQTV